VVVQINKNVQCSSISSEIIIYKFIMQKTEVYDHSLAQLYKPLRVLRT
jgi:hypothetical protein